MRRGGAATFFEVAKSMFPSWFNISPLNHQRRGPGCILKLHLTDSSEHEFLPLKPCPHSRVMSICLETMVKHKKLKLYRAAHHNWLSLSEQTALQCEGLFKVERSSPDQKGRTSRMCDVSRTKHQQGGPACHISTQLGVGSRPGFSHVGWHKPGRTP